MDTFENQNNWNDPNVDAIRQDDNREEKISPFADSVFEPNPDVIRNAVPKSPIRKKAPHKGLKTVVSIFLVILLVAGGCGLTAGIMDQMWQSRMNTMMLSFKEQIEAVKESNLSNQNASGLPGGSVTLNPSTTVSPRFVYEKCIDSVVAITAYAKTGNNSKSVSTGSGFILTEDGYVVTNYHVVGNADSLSVTTTDGKEHEAKLIGADETNDVALIKISATGLQAVSIGSSDALAVGDMVIAIGNPLGELTSTQTVGYISGKDRDVSTDGSVINMLQTDAAINSGNSGGPLFNILGQVVGITTAKYSGTTNSGASIEGIGFAIPIDDVIGILDDLRVYGYVTGGYLGVSVSDMDSTTASLYNLPVGAFVHEVVKDGSAHRAGMLAEDIIISLGGHEIKSVNDLTRALRKFKGGDQATVTVFRSGKEVELLLTLDEKPQTVTQQPSPTDPNMPDIGDPEEWYNYYAPFFGNKG